MRPPTRRPRPRWIGPATAASPSVHARPGPSGDRNRIFATPIARKIAHELGVDLPVPAPDPAAASAGRRTRGRQLLRLRPRPSHRRRRRRSPRQRPSHVAPRMGGIHTRLRRLVASRLQASKQTAPHFYLRASLRVDELLALRAQLNAAGEKISVNDFVVKAAARALIDVPEMNVIWTEEAVLQAPTADVAVAVASERGLVTPVIPDVDALSMSALSAKIKDAVARANTGKLQQSELEGRTLTVSNLGMYGIEEFDAILNPPQAEILAVGTWPRAGRR